MADGPAASPQAQTVQPASNHAKTAPPEEPTWHSWELLPGETARAYAAFSAYRDMGPARSWDKAFAATQQHQNAPKTAPKTWSDWAAKYHWSQRVRDYDRFVELRDRAVSDEEHNRELAKYRARQRDLARDTLSATNQTLEKLNARLNTLEVREITAKLIPAYLRAVAAIAHAATEAEANALAIEELMSVLDADGP